MNLKVLIYFFITLPFIIYVPGVSAQDLNIKGDTLFVNAEAELQITFPTLPNSFSTVPNSTDYHIKSLGTSVVVTANVENAKSALLRVSEGGRNHNFMVIFKKEINFSDVAATFKDYSTKAKLDQHIRETDSKSANEMGSTITDSRGDPKKEPAVPEEGTVMPKPDKSSNTSSLAKNNDDKYYSMTIEAKNNLDQKNYLQAKDNYEKALELKPGDVFATRQLKKIADDLQEEKDQKDREKLNGLYKGYIAEGDIAFQKSEFTEARNAYNQALEIRKNDAYVTKRLKVIDEKEKQQKVVENLNNDYDMAIELADKLFNSGDYSNAKEQYTKALALIKKDYPKSQLAKIDKIIAEEIARIKLEEESLAKEADISSRYLALINSADKEFNNKNYIRAKKIYNDATNLKASEQYPGERLKIIEGLLAQNEAMLKARNDSIERAGEINKKYQLNLNKGKSYYVRNDLVSAKGFYEEALALKPSEEEPRNQLETINIKLAEIEKQKIIDQSYIDKISLADSLRNIKMYDAALILYKEASGLKPLESYPGTLMKIVQSDLAEIERIKIQKKRIEEDKLYQETIQNANKAGAEKRYSDAQTHYIFAQKIRPLNETDSIRFKNVLYQLGKMQADSLSQASLAQQNVPAKSKGRKSSSAKKKNTRQVKGEIKKAEGSLVFQKDPLPYSVEELKMKYPHIDFLNLPADQPFNKTAVSTQKNIVVYDSLVLEKPRLNLSADNLGIKAICEGIDFDGTTAYFKILIQNNSKSDFLTGYMMLTWKRRSGNNIKLYPSNLFPSPLPVIKPGNEAIIIYVCKTYDILDDELLTFELKDRLNKVNLQIVIPGSAYTREWVRY